MDLNNSFICFSENVPQRHTGPFSFPISCGVARLCICKGAFVEKFETCIFNIHAGRSSLIHSRPLWYLSLLTDAFVSMPHQVPVLSMEHLDIDIKAFASYDSNCFGNNLDLLIAEENHLVLG